MRWGTQTKIAQAIRDGGGHYVLALKENWPATLAEVELLFSAPPAGRSNGGWLQWADRDPPPQRLS